jgi:DNA primase
VEALASEAGIVVPRQESFSPEAEQKRKGMLEWVALAQAWFVRQLESEAGAEARIYLERRGLSKADMERFGIGFAPESRRGLTRVLTQKGAKPAELVEAGLIIQPDDGGEPYDRFRGRVMFPISDPRGRVVAFGGRAMSKDVRAKYLNSPETPLFHKGSILYRYPEARAFAHDSKVKAKGLLVAEGYMDVIAFERAGLGHAVAPLGTALTEGQIRLLWRAGSEPIICLDGDSAGTRAAALAAERALPLLEPGKTLRFVFLEDGSDPDDILRDKGAEALKDAIAQPKPLVDVIWERELAVEPLDDPDRRAGFRKRLRALAAKISDVDVKAEYRAEFDRRLEQMFSRGNAGTGFSSRGHGRYGVVSGPTGELKRKVKQSGSTAMARQLVLAVVEIPKIAEIEAEMLAGLDLGVLDPLRDAALDVCLSGELVSAENIRELLKNKGFGADLSRLKSDLAAMRAGLGGEEADDDERIEAWRRLANTYMERTASDALTRQDRDRDLEILEKGDSDALISFVAAHRRNKKHR